MAESAPNILICPTLLICLGANNEPSKKPPKYADIKNPIRKSLKPSNSALMPKRLPCIPIEIPMRAKPKNNGQIEIASLKADIWSTLKAGNLQFIFFI